ncbi:MAG: hypothetical protein LBS50_11445 [Prevotellaceae bacterium]|jgi:uncharacterized protein (TIGR02145 family)|nr:hypothetical protein [Prevotellaceae bacterium]
MKISKKFNFPTASILMLTLGLAMSGNARAQVTVGADLEPQPFSVLELISNDSKGLRLPQLTTGLRDTVLMKSTDFIAEKKGKALGLTIFNTSTNCVNTWNGTKWIEECMSCDDLIEHVNVDLSICQNQLPYTWRDQIFPVGQSSEDLVYNRTNIVGCDSIVHLNLTVKDSIIEHTSLSICQNQLPYTWRDQILPVGQSSEVIIYNETNIAGCDSIVYLHLTVKDSVIEHINLSICQNQLPYSDWRGKTFPVGQSSEVIIYNETNIEGCDSIVYLHLTVNNVSFPALGSVYNFCTGATVANLAAETSADIYNAATDGTKYDATTSLSASVTYYAEQRVANCVNPVRTAVTVNLGSCSSAVTGAGITTFVNVMYDFQHQTLEAYNTGGGIATQYRWQVSTTTADSDFTDISDAPNSAFYTVPAYYADAYATGTELYFRCIISNPATATPLKTANLGIVFIRTNTAGYGIDGNIRYLTLQRGLGGTVGAGSMKVALLVLGQSADWQGEKVYTPNNDAGDLGDFYQWGRVADGHQNVVWSKNASHVNQILPYGTTPAQTSSNIARSTSYTYDANGQIQNSNNAYGKFITTNSDDWRTSSNKSLWGDGNKSSSTRASDILLSSDWVYPANNPCPYGWRIPAKWSVWDLYRGTGSGTSIAVTDYNGTDNTWQKRSANNNSVGGVIITNSAGEKLFLPANGTRTIAGNLGGENSTYFWSCTYGLSSIRAYALKCNDLSVDADISIAKVQGLCVRCVADF